MIASSTLKLAVACIGFTTFASGNTLLYTRDPAYELSCTDPTSFPCGPTICCVPEAYCQDVNDVPTCQPPPTTPAPEVCPTDATLVQCAAYSHCCPAGETCSQDATLTPLCNNGPAPGDYTPPTPQELCENTARFWCDLYSICCEGSAACSQDNDGVAQCGQGNTGTPPVTPPPVTPPTQNPPVQNPPNGSSSRSTSATRSSSSSSSSTTATAAGSGNNAVKGASMGVAGALGAAGLAVVLMA